MNNPLFAYFSFFFFWLAFCLFSAFRFLCLFLTFSHLISSVLWFCIFCVFDWNRPFFGILDLARDWSKAKIETKKQNALDDKDKSVGFSNDNSNSNNRKRIDLRQRTTKRLIFSLARAFFQISKIIKREKKKKRDINETLTLRGKNRLWHRIKQIALFEVFFSYISLLSRHPMHI